MILGTTLYPIAMAEATVADLQAHEEDGWTYTVMVVNEERGLAQIEVVDDEGVFVGYI